MTNLNDSNGILIEGHIKIFDPITKNIFVNQRNAIHYENMSIALAESLANQGQGFIHEMSFGNGGTSVDPTGIITYLTPNSTGTNASLYNQTYTKIVDERSVNNSIRVSLEALKVMNVDHRVNLNSNSLSAQIGF